MQYIEINYLTMPSKVKFTMLSFFYFALCPFLVHLHAKYDGTGSWDKKVFLWKCVHRAHVKLWTLRTHIILTLVPTFVLDWIPIWKGYLMSFTFLSWAVVVVIAW